jgi:hypothetical protein
MIVLDERETIIPDETGVKVVPVAPATHPRILARMQLIALTRTRDRLLAQLNQLIDSLEHLSPRTDQVSIKIDQLRNLLDQLIFGNIASYDGLTLLEHIKQHTTEIKTEFAISYSAILETDS